MNDTPPSSRQPRWWRRWLPWFARLLVLALLGGWFVFFADRESFAATFASIPLKAFVPAWLLVGGVIALASVRWQVLMRSLEATHVPSCLSLARLFLIGVFYNTFLPGAVGGDVLRGVVTQRFFGRRAASYVVVFLERLVGFTAMAAVFLAGLAMVPEVINVRQHAPWVGALFAMGIVALAVAAAGGRLRRLQRSLPPIRLLGLVWVFLLSATAHCTAITAVFVLAQGMGLPLRYAELVLVMPLAFTAMSLPINLFGIGGRELTLVALLGALGLSREQALALSLGYGVVHLLWAALGGLLQLLQGRVGPASSPAASAVSEPPARPGPVEKS